MALTVDALLCPQNHRCPLIPICPAGAISQEGNSLPRIDPGKCIECGKCVKRCGMQAVYKAKELAVPGDIVTLSPACASFDMFPNFAVRGNKFKEIVNCL